MSSIPLSGDRRKSIRGNPWGSQVLTGSLDSATGTERGPYNGFVASKNAWPVAVIGAVGCSVASGPIQTPLKSGCAWEVVKDFRHPGKGTRSMTTASLNK